MKLSNLTFIRFGVLALAILLFLIGAGVSSCSAQYAFNSPSKSSITGDFKEIKWPTSGVAQMLPEPESKYGEISIDSSTAFYAYIGNTTADQYDAYVEKCQEAGFSVDYTKAETYYYADNEERYDLSLSYDSKESYMTISLNSPVESSSSSASTSSSSSQASSSAAEMAASSTANDAPVDGIRPSIKEAIDSYEKFFDDYCAFMEKYSNDPGSSALIADYAKFMSQYSETMDKLDQLGDEDLSAQELQYYTDAMSRINTKLANTAGAM